MKNQNLYAVVELKYDINTDEYYEVIMAMFGNKENAEEYINQENEIELKMSELYKLNDSKMVGILI